MIKLTDIRKKLPFRMNKNNTVESIKNIVEGHYGDVWDFDIFLPSKGKNLQRPLVWNLFQKQQLVLSVLKGIKLQPLSLIQFKNSNGVVPITWKVVDGKQRLTTLISFYKNEFPIVVNETEVYYNDLDDDAKREIWNLQLSADVAYEYYNELISDNDKIAWFEMINFSGTLQDIEHLNNLKK